MKTLFYGHDFGNSETDGVMLGQGQDIIRSMPTAEAVAPSEKRAKNLGVSYGNSVLFRLFPENTTYIIGEGALTQGKGATSQRGNISRYSSMQSVRAMLANSGMMTHEKVYRLHVVTGIPVETYAEDSGIRDKIADAMSGPYTFVLNGNDERTVEVKIERVIAEGAGAIISYGTGEKVLQGVIDCGGRTLDLYVSRGQTPQIQQCKSFVLGVETALDLLKQQYLKQYNATLSTADARAIMFACISAGQVAFPTLAVRGKEVPSSEQFRMASEAIKVVGEQVAATIASAWSEGETTDQVATSFKNIFFIGRGAMYFMPYVQRVLAAEQLKEVTSPGSANAYGYASLARSFALRTLSAAS